MDITNKCKVCGGFLEAFSDEFVRCKYCGQIYGLSGEIVSEATIYKTAKGYMAQNNIESNKTAAMLFNGIPGYQDSKAFASACLNANRNIEAQIEQKRLDEIRNREIAEQQQRLAKEKQKKKTLICTVAVMVIILTAIAVVSGLLIHKRNVNKTYQEAVELFENEKYEEAKELFEGIENCKDSKSYLKDIDNILADQEEKYSKGISSYESGAYFEAIEYFSLIYNYKDSKEYINKAADGLFTLAQKKIDEGKYEEAREYINSIPDSVDLGEESTKLLSEIDEKIKKAEYESAIDLFNSGDYEKSREKFLSLGSYEDTKSYLNDIGQIYYEQAKELYDEGDYISCVEKIQLIDEQKEWSSYKDAEELKNNACTAHIDSIRSEALIVLGEEGYSSFVEYVNSRNDVIFGDEERNSLLSEYENSKPIQLTDLDLYDSKNDTYYSEYTIYDETAEDVFGNTYEHSIGIKQYKWDGSEPQYAAYLINNNYNHLSGTITYELSNNGFKYTDGSAVIKIYSDDECIYTSPSISKSTNPIDIDVDLGETHILTIYWCEEDGDPSCVLLGNPQLYNLPTN